MDSSSRPSYEWSNEKILYFLELYFMETPIWNPNDPRHKDRNEVFDAWKRLEEALGFQYSITELKKKRENLMSTYRKLYNKVRASRLVGEIFKPDWFAYETMSRYLNDIYDSRPCKQEEGEDPNSEFEESAHSEDDVKDFEVPVNPEHIVVNNSDVVTNVSSGTRSKRKRKHCPEENGLDESSQTAKKTPVLEDSTSPEECALFCELLGVKLRALNDHFRETAMFEINNIMHHLKMQQAAQAAAGGGYNFCGSPCPAHMPPYSYPTCPRMSFYNYLPSTPQMKNTPQNSRQ